RSPRDSCDRAWAAHRNSPPRSARAARSGRSASSATARRRPGTRTRPRSAGPGRAKIFPARRYIRSPASPAARSRSARRPRGSCRACAAWPRSRRRRDRRARAAGAPSAWWFCRACRPLLPCIAGPRVVAADPRSGKGRVRERSTGRHRARHPESSKGDSAMPSAPAQRATAVPNDLEAYWLPFTPNRAFKAAPRLIARAKDMHYYTPDGRAVLDGTAGMWCTNAGHNRDPIVAAIQAEAAALDYAPAFQFAHPKAFELASRVAALAPGDLDHVFFCNSGSEAVDTALKIALAYHNVRGEGARTRLIGRERGYHGVGFGGISVGGMVNNRKLFGALLAGVDHLPTTYSREHQAFSEGEPDWGGHLADELERIVTLHDASTIAAVIVEPMAGSTRVLPAPQAYLPRLHALCPPHTLPLLFP